MFTIETGSPYPLGATWDGEGANFAVFAAGASKVELCLFDGPDSSEESERLALPGATDEVRHGYVRGLRPGRLYGYRVDGPYNPAEALYFNPCKLLFDPYAKAVGRPLRWDDALFAYPAVDGAPADPDAVLRRDERDSAPYSPLGAVIDDAFDWQDDRTPRTSWRDTIIYELHVKGFTKLHPDVPEHLRGTYAGLANQAAVSYLHELGVTAVELLPVHFHIDDPRLVKLGLTNYWGYNTLGFFAPEPGYAADRSPAGAVREFKGMVKALHAAGIEVILDVVYNHTAEADIHGPTLSLRGLSAVPYYRLDEHDRRSYVDYTGCGNTLDTRNPRALQLIMDSLRYWAIEMHVDGFRFDLASALAREEHGFDLGSGFFDILAQDPVLSRLKLIAEPWDLGAGGYRVGGFPPGWSEWNGRFRDDVRRFWKGDHDMAGVFATRLSGSSDLYDHDGRAPTAGVNFITSHDGFTLHDLVAYEQKRNETNGEENRDGDSNNNNWNCGAEGETDDSWVLELRERQKRNLLATLLLSIGVPMLTAGDEFSRTQRGNNNAYCQDNEVSWIDWDLKPAQRSLLKFVRRLIALRRSHGVSRRTRFLAGKPNGDGTHDVAWYGPAGRELTSARWERGDRRLFAALIGPDGDGEPLLYAMFNGSNGGASFRLPRLPGVEGWECVFDTARREAGPALEDPTHCEVAAWSFVLLRIVAAAEGSQG